MDMMSYLTNSSPQWVESLYRDWEHDPASVPSEWQLFFSGFELGDKSGLHGNPATPLPADEYLLKVSGVQSLIFRYRSIGHLLACTDPLSPCRLSHPQLDLAAFDLNETDLDTVFPTRRFADATVPLCQVVATLRATYCHEIGVEFMHIPDPDERQWLIDRMEPCRNQLRLDQSERLRLLEKLHEANLFELFLQRRFPAQKRFSLEGGEGLIPALDVLARLCVADGVTDLILGMPHRGRLNVLANIFGKPYENIFAEFRDTMETGFVGDGDVKYHKGYSCDCDYQNATLHLTLASNPSHLEAVNPVVEGKCRARQDRCDKGASAVLPVLIHGDAAFAGQGSVMETLSLSQLDGYRTGGTLHIVLNNQIGFTTPPKDSRSTLYATDVAKIVSCPIFHVQGESPEAIRHAINLAFQYRQQFRRDVVVELVCYRRHGHNEGDEPAFTQPLMYQEIASRPPANRIYADLLRDSGISLALLEELEGKVQQRLEDAFENPPQPHKVGFGDVWEGISSDYRDEPPATGVAAEKILLLARKLANLPPGFTPHPKLVALVQKRFESVLKGGTIDWGTAETLAYATLLDEGHGVRLSGQDCCRGTFSHRHAVLHDIHDGHTTTPLANLASVADGTGRFQVWNSSLSEFGVLGFEYGYSLETPHGLTIWEAQFGDFANGAQVVLDQFVASGETKWNRASGLVLMLPHGYEGMGAEHSSARIERFLQLCANHNLQVANPTTPAQLFHLLRRQLKQSFRKPLVIFTPKSLLRHPACVSPLGDLYHDRFYPLLPDSLPADSVRQVLLCSGKIYYDLLAERTHRGDNATAILRIEQLYPFSEQLLKQLLAGYRSDTRYCWVQEEPENMGAWQHLAASLQQVCGSLRSVARPADACPAVGSHALHQQQQQVIISSAFDGR